MALVRIDRVPETVKVNLPWLFISVNRQEVLYPLSVHFHAACQTIGIQSEYHEEDGAYDWFFWDRQIRHFLAAILGPVLAA